MKPLYIPRRQVKTFPGEGREILRAVSAGETFRGDGLDRFESWFSEYLGTPGALAAPSGRSALALILKGFGIGRGDEVILPAFTFKAVPAMLVRLGIKPVFVDADPETFNMSIDGVRERINARTKAVIATHLFGFPMDMGALMDVARGAHVRVIEDCAHAVGAQVGDRRVGGIGDAGFFSFGVSKDLNTFAGGMVVSRDGEFAGRCRRLMADYPLPPAWRLAIEVARTFFYRLSVWEPFFVAVEKPLFGMLKNWDIDYFSILRKRKREYADFFFRFSNLQALVGLRQVDSVDANIEIRRTQAQFLNEAIPPGMTGPRKVKGTKPSHFMFVLRHEQKGKICRELFRRRIDVNLVFMDCCPPMFGDRSGYPVSERLFAECFFVQLGPRLSIEHLKYLAESLAGILATL